MVHHIRLTLFIILCYYDPLPTASSHLVKKRDLVIHRQLSINNNGLHDNLQHLNKHRRLSKSKHPERQTGQRIVILAGPHKTASTSVQHNIYDWTSSDLQILPNWSWPVPHEVLEDCEEDRKRIRQEEGKQYKPHRIQRNCNSAGFYPLGEAIYPNFRNKRPLFRKYKKPVVMKLYRDVIGHEWKMGKNIVMGTEALDFLIDHDYGLDNFISVLPINKENNGASVTGAWGASTKDVTIVVKFRAPRVEHLISIWHECCMVGPKGITFMEFLNNLSEKQENNNLRILESLQLCNLFLERGFNVVLIDMAGVNHEGYDISNVVACDVLNANCTVEEQLVLTSGEENKEVNPVINRVKRGKGDMGGVTDYQLNKIDKLLRTYDCRHQHVLEHENLTVLYEYELGSILSECAKLEGIDHILSRHELAEKIRSVVNGTNGDEYYANSEVDQT